MSKSSRWRQRPVVVIPGITATSLVDEYPLSREVLWSQVLHHEFERLAMHPGDTRYEAIQPSRVRAGRRKLSENRESTRQLLLHCSTYLHPCRRVEKLNLAGFPPDSR